MTRIKDKSPAQLAATYSGRADDPNFVDPKFVARQRALRLALAALHRAADIRQPDDRGRDRTMSICRQVAWLTEAILHNAHLRHPNGDQYADQNTVILRAARLLAAISEPIPLPLAFEAALNRMVEEEAGR